MIEKQATDSGLFIVILAIEGQFLSEGIANLPCENIRNWETVRGGCNWAKSAPRQNVLKASCGSAPLVI